MARRFIFVVKMVLQTLAIWPLSTWCKFWLTRFNVIELKGCLIHLRDDSYISQVADLAMAWEVLMDGVYDRFPIQATDTVVDIGAHIGSFSIKAASNCIDGKVFAFEPFPATYSVLAKNLSSRSNVTCIQKCIAGTRGEQQLFVSDANPAENSLTRQTDKSVAVQSITLKDVLETLEINSIDLLKVDCEGAEFDIIYNSRDELQSVKKIVMEVHEPALFNIEGAGSINDLCRFIGNCGFSVEFKRENRFQGYIFAEKLQ